MASLRLLLSVGIYLSAGSITTAEELSVPRAEKLRWISLDFKTVLTWTTKPSPHTYTVLVSADDGDWTENPDCIGISATECDMTNVLQPFDRSYSADIQTDAEEYDDDELPHTFSSVFNPYRESNISTVKFTLHPTGDGNVTVNITDTLTAVHHGKKQLTIRDVLRSDLKYKITYYKAGSTGKREVISASSVAEVSKLDAGEAYCFIVSAFVPSRPKDAQLGAPSPQQCTQIHGTATGLSLGALVGIVFILITVLIIIIIVAVLCCNCCRQRNKSFQTSQTSAPV